MLQTVFTWIWLSSGVLLMISVLLHSPKGDGMGGLASSGSSMFSSARSAEATLNRITWTLLAIFLGLATALSALLGGRAAEAAAKAADPQWQLSDAEWKRRLSPAAYAVLRQEGTERPFSSPLNAEKRSGTYHCAGCDLALFSSKVDEYADPKVQIRWPEPWAPQSISS